MGLPGTKRRMKGHGRSVPIIILGDFWSQKGQKRKEALSMWHLKLGALTNVLPEPEKPLDVI